MNGIVANGLRTHGGNKMKDKFEDSTSLDLTKQVQGLLPVTERE